MADIAKLNIKNTTYDVEDTLSRNRLTFLFDLINKSYNAMCLMDERLNQAIYDFNRKKTYQ